MSETVLIDTNIWHYAYVEPKEDEYSQLHLQTKQFLSRILENPNIEVCLSVYQVGEIIEMLRRAHIDVNIRENIIKDFLSTGFILKELTCKDVISCFEKSKISNIHIYDYLVVIPVKDIVQKIYSADDHFQHLDFTTIAQVINPLYPWILREGCRPYRIATSRL